MENSAKTGMDRADSKEELDNIDGPSCCVYLVSVLLGIVFIALCVLYFHRILDDKPGRMQQF